MLKKTQDKARPGPDAQYGSEEIFTIEMFPKDGRTWQDLAFDLDAPSQDRERIRSMRSTDWE